VTTGSTDHIETSFLKLVVAGYSDAVCYLHECEPATGGHTFTAFTNRVLRNSGVLVMRARTLKLRINPEGVRQMGTSFGVYVIQVLPGNPVSSILLDCVWVQKTPEATFEFIFVVRFEKR
jgi:hypothetical protein